MEFPDSRGWSSGWKNMHNQKIIFFTVFMGFEVWSQTNPLQILRPTMDKGKISNVFLQSKCCIYPKDWPLLSAGEVVFSALHLCKPAMVPKPKSLIDALQYITRHYSAFWVRCVWMMEEQIGLLMNKIGHWWLNFATSYKFSSKPLVKSKSSL